MRCADLSDCNLSGTDLTEADFSGANIKGANFKNAIMKNTNLSTIVWNNVICPDGTNSNENGFSCEKNLKPKNK